MMKFGQILLDKFFYFYFFYWWEGRNCTWIVLFIYLYFMCEQVDVLTVNRYL